MNENQNSLTTNLIKEHQISSQKNQNSRQRGRQNIGQNIQTLASPQASSSVGKRKVLIIIFSIIVLLLIIFGIIGYFYYKNKNESSSSGEEKEDGQEYELPSEEMKEEDPKESIPVYDDLDDIEIEDDLEDIEIEDDLDDFDLEESPQDAPLKQFEGFTTIAKTQNATQIDIDKGTYTSPKGKYKFKFQEDNNVIIQSSEAVAVWATRTNHSSDSYLRLEDNGNLIVNRIGETVWESGTTGGGEFLALNDQGQLAMLSQDGEVIEYIVEFHRGNANISAYILNNSDLYRYFSSWSGPSSLSGLCMDKIEGCKGHKRRGGCSSANSNHDSWRTNCVNTCGYCHDPQYNPGTTIRRCEDKRSDCATHKANGGCTSGNPDHHKWRTDCVRTCGYCHDYRYYNPTGSTCEDKRSNCDTHKGNGGCRSANPNHHMWRTDCVYTCGYCNDSTYNKPQGSQNMHANVSLSVDYGWDVQGIINHYINRGRDEGFTMNFITEQDDIFNQEGFQVKIMPYEMIKTSNFEYGGQEYSSDWIWKSEMPQQVGGDITSDYFTNHNMMSVPIEVVKFYYDYRHNFETEINAIFLVHVDNHADIIFNDRYIKSVKGGPHQVSVTLKPGKNRFMCACRNTGGPAAFKAVLIDPISEEQLMSTNLNWRYIDDLVNIMGLDANMIRNGEYLEFMTNEWTGAHQFHYDYVNKTGQDQELKIKFNFDNYGVLWIDRKLINSKSMNDDTAFYAIVPPGKSHICVEIMDYGGPGRLSGTIEDIETGETVLSTNDEGWRYIVAGSKPGPWEPVTVYEHGNFAGRAKQFWIGHFDRYRMENRGMSNDMITTVKVPKMLELTIWDDDEKSPKGRYSRLMTSDGEVGSRMNDRTSSLTVKTRTKDRVYFFRDLDGNNGGGGYGDTSWHIEQQGMSNFHPQMGGESKGNSDNNKSGDWSQGCKNGEVCRTSLININEDQITSLWVPKGFEVIIYERPDYTGPNIKTLEPKNYDRWEVAGSELNDDNSAIKVYFDFNIGSKFNIMNDYLL